MDASKITELRMKQANRYINRAKTVDSSTLTWQQQIQSSTFIPSLVPTATNYNQVNACNNCSAESKIALSSNSVGSTVALYPNPMLGSGSATTVYSSDKVLYYNAGKTQCGNLPLNVVTPQYSALTSQYIILPECECSNTNIGPIDPSNPRAMLPPPGGYNLYLPIPTTIPTGCAPCVEQNTPSPANLAAAQEQVLNNGGTLVNNRFVPTDPAACATNSVRATMPTKLP